MRENVTEGSTSLFEFTDPLQRRADEIARADFAEDVNLDLQRVYSGLLTVEEFEEMYGR